MLHFLRSLSDEIRITYDVLNKCLFLACLAHNQQLEADLPENRALGSTEGKENFNRKHINLYKVTRSQGILQLPEETKPKTTSATDLMSQFFTAPENQAALAQKGGTVELLHEDWLIPLTKDTKDERCLRLFLKALETKRVDLYLTELNKDIAERLQELEEILTMTLGTAKRFSVLLQEEPKFKLIGLYGIFVDLINDPKAKSLSIDGQSGIGLEGDITWKSNEQLVAGKKYCLIEKFIEGAKDLVLQQIYDRYLDNEQ